MSSNSTMTRSYRSGRGEPFELVTRAKHSLPVRMFGFLIRWRLELVLSAAALIAWSQLTHWMPAWAAVVLVGLVAQGLAWFEPTRLFVWRRVLAVLTRHRLRAVFVERRIMNYSGNLPLLLWSHPTDVGDRVWILLRAGIDVLDLEANLPYLASGCMARTARATAWKAMTAVVVVDVVRRDPLAAATPVPSAVATEPPDWRPPLQLVPALDPPAVELGA